MDVDVSDGRPGDEHLIRQVLWVQRLAYAILRDWQLAEDVSQEVLLRALQSDSRHSRVRRVWLAAVTKNLAQNVLRDRARLESREFKAAKAGEVPPAKTPLEVLESLRSLTRAIEHLTPEQREVVVLRYFEDLSFEDIAIRLSIRETAVHMRLHRALGSMRRELSIGGQDWHALCMLALPSSLARTLQDVSISGGLLIMKSATWKVASIAIAILLLLLVTLIWLEFPPAIPVQELADPGTLVAEDSGTNEASLARAEAVVPEAGQDQVSADELLPELQLHSEAVTGRVYFAGIVVPGAEVEVRQGGESQSCITDSEGYFHAVIDPNARVTLVARSDSAYALEEAWSGWPRRLNLRPIAELADRVRVVDSDDERPIQGAMVKVWECFYPPTGNYVSAKEGATLVGEGVTGVDGVLQLLAPLPLAFYCFEANAPGYVSNFLEADVRSGAYQIGLVRGEDPILYVLDAEGRPMPTSEVLFGSPVFQVYPVDEEGKVRGRLGWNHPWQEEELRDFMVRLPSGRFWHSPQASGSSPDVQVADGKIECRIPDPEVAVELQGMALPEGAWIEAARYLKRHHWALLGYGIDDPGIIGTSDFLQKPWQSLVLGQSVNLDRGWAGQDLAVIARIQPGSQILGVFPIVDGRAVVHQVEIARLRLGVVGLPEFGAGTWLAFLRTLDQKRSMDSQYTEPVEIEHDYAEFLAPAGSYSLTLEHSTGLARYRLKKNQFLPLSVGGPSYEEKLILGAGETSLSCQVESVEWRRVQITLGGFPVPGGSLGSSKIDLAGWTALPADHNGMISISSLMQLSIPPELGLGPDTPIHVNDFFPKAIDVQLAAGAEAVLDFPLASFVIDPRGIDLSVGYSLHITSRSDYSVRSENLFPPSFTDNRSKQGWSDRKIGITQSNVNWVFRVPEGQYQVWLIEYPSREKDAKERQVVELTPPGGKFLPRDMQTVLSRQD